ncbi:MAG TPA: AMP-binding protein, partial [Mycobacterium sp.]
MRTQYADYALWQREVLGDPADPASELARHLEYWRDALVDAPEESTITPDRARPAEPTHHGRDIRFTVDPGIAAGLREVANHHGVTMFMIVQVAAALAVSAFGGGDDVVIGSPVGGRTEDGLEDLVGYFVNTLPLRHRLRPADTIVDVLERTRLTVLDGFAHQAAPFELIANAAGVERSASRNPVFQVMLTHRNFTGQPDSLTFPQITVRRQAAPVGAVKTDLDLYVTETPGALAGSLSYATELFDPATAERFLTALQQTLTAIATNVDTPIAGLNLLPTDASSRVAVGVVQEFPDVSVDALIRDQAGVSPAAVAVVDDGDGSELSYAEFDARVNAFAQVLIERGVTVGDRVAVALPRSANLVVALVGVLRAGAAYAPVDPEYPDERIRAIVEDSGAVLVVTDLSTAVDHRDALAHNGVQVVVLDDDMVRDRVEHGRSEPPSLPRPLSAEDAAYVIFTSGTTGRPKGVVLSHRAVVNRLVWGRKALGFTPADRVLLKTAFTFDVSVPELFLPLITGAAIVVAADGRHGDPAYIGRVVRERQVTSVHFVPSMLQAFLDSGPEPESLSSLRHVSFSGESLSARAAVDASRLFQNAGLFNLYGPTEAAVEITGYELPALNVEQARPQQKSTDGHVASRSRIFGRNILDDATTEIAGLDPGAGSTPIGRPVANSFVRVLDGWLRPVPAGVTGELYLGGVQLAEGYAGRPALTAARFVADPVTESGAKLYRTGDLARWNEHGQLEYLGRSDDQVKIRGFRIEPGEIGAVLERHEAVSGAVVAALDRPAGGQFLAAYLTTIATPVNDSALEDALREHATALLPEYMVPATFTFLDAFPVTSSGKLDRKSLPVPDLATSTAGRPPESETELALAEVFRDVLHLDEHTPLSVDDDFFRLGGHSLLATRVVARVNTARAVSVSLREVFDHPTIAGLARVVDEGSTAQARGPVLRVGDIERPALLPLSYGQQALWVTDQIAGRTIYRTAMAVLSTTPVEIGALQAAVCNLVTRHEILRTTFMLDADTAELRQIIHRPPAPGTALVSVKQVTSAETNARMAELLAAPIDLSSDFGLRFCLLRREEDDLLIASGHHIVTDQQSFVPFLRDLNALYRDELAGVAPQLDALPVQFADFALW